MPLPIAAILGVLKEVGPVIAKALEGLKPLLEKLVIYRKGRSDQKQADRIARLEREGQEVSRASERIEDERAKRMEERYGDPPGDDDPHVRVRGKRPRGW